MYQSLVSFDYWTLVAQLINFGIQLLLFKCFLFEPVRKILEKRQQEVDDLYSNAEKANNDANALKTDYEDKLSTAHQMANEITSNALSSAKLQSEQIVENAKKEADIIKIRAEREIEQDKAAALKEAKGEISQMAIDIATKIVEKEIDPNTHNALISKFIDEMGQESL